ncbi:MAG: hypothetical protein KIS62_01360 [Ramlibacter sp.]|nr:hypothetical protein [Ramlibacter sp.]
MKIEWNESAGTLHVQANSEGERRYLRRLLAGPLREGAPSVESSLNYEVMALGERALVRMANFGYRSPDTELYADEFDERNRSSKPIRLG